MADNHTLNNCSGEVSNLLNDIIFFTVSPKSNNLKEFVIKLSNCNDVRTWMKTCVNESSLFPGDIVKMSLNSVNSFNDIKDFNGLPKKIISDWKLALEKEAIPKIFTRCSNGCNNFHRVSFNKTTGEFIICMASVMNNMHWLVFFEGHLSNELSNKLTDELNDSK